MSNVLAALKKRRCYPVEGHEGVFVRPLTRGEIDTAVRLEATNALAAMDFSIASALTDESGSPVLPQNAGEELDGYLSRITPDLAEIPSDTLMDLQAAIESAGRKIKNLEKKLPPTNTPDG
jgi:hypothetical protein